MATDRLDDFEHVRELFEFAALAELRGLFVEFVSKPISVLGVVGDVNDRSLAGLADDLGEGLEQPSPDGETPIQEPGATETEATHPHGAEREQRTSLARRVGQAIERAAAEDDNLAFAILQYPEHAEIELEELEQTFADAAEAEVVDLMDKRFAVLLPRHDLGHALHRLKRLQTERAAEQELPAPSVGLSARNGRLISGDRLINEARVALQRAEREPERIMAFSADPNRFREYIARRR